MMDLITVAASLRQQLVSLDNSDNNIRLLGSRLETLGGECARAELANNRFHQLRALVRLSVCEGVHHVYQQYSSSKWQQVQSTARCIKSSIENSRMDTVPSSLTSSSQSRSVPDKAASAWSRADMEFYRRD